MSWRSGTGLGRPVVPDVNWMIASPAWTGRAGTPARQRTAGGSITAATPVAAIARSRSASGTRGLSGTNAPPTDHTANHDAIGAGTVRCEHTDRLALEPRRPGAAGRSPRPGRAARRASSRLPCACTTTSSGSPSSSSASAGSQSDLGRAGAGRSSRVGGRCASGSAARRPSACAARRRPVATSSVRHAASVPSSHACSNAAHVGRSGSAQITIASVSLRIATRNAATHSSPLASVSKRPVVGERVEERTRAADGELDQLVGVHRALRARRGELLDRRAPRFGHRRCGRSRPAAAPPRPPTTRPATDPARPRRRARARSCRRGRSNRRAPTG